ncbi:MAG: hypothetical protein GWN32_15830 [Gemmatimonadetes bacterium]|nr:hypothetical protein [Gemmatimonadota bacterium]
MLRIDLGTIGPALLTAGVIDLERLEDVYTRQGHPLAPQEREILEQGTDTTVVLDSGNARFLLDLLWGLGLANRNRLLHEGPMMEAGGGRVDRYASTGGWRYARRPLSEIYGGFAVVPLTPEQEAWVGTAAFAVYRPCCNNPTALPDCNHGMAMLGLFTLLANRGASVEEMLDAAYLASAAWFPYQTGEVSHFLSAALGVRRAAAVRSLASGPDLFSATGYRAVQAWLSKNGMAPVASGGVVSAC